MPKFLGQLRDPKGIIDDVFGYRTEAADGGGGALWHASLVILDRQL